MAFPTMPDQETLELAAAGAARALGEDHRATQAMAKAAITMDKADLTMRPRASPGGRPRDSCSSICWTAR